MSPFPLIVERFLPAVYNSPFHFAAMLCSSSQSLESIYVIKVMSMHKLNFLFFKEVAVSRDQCARYIIMYKDYWFYCQHAIYTNLEDHSPVCIYERCESVMYTVICLQFCDLLYYIAWDVLSHWYLHAWIRRNSYTVEFKLSVINW